MDKAPSPSIFLHLPRSVALSHSGFESFSVSVFPIRFASFTARRGERRWLEGARLAGMADPYPAWPRPPIDSLYTRAENLFELKTWGLTFVNLSGVKVGEDIVVGASLLVKVGGVWIFEVAGWECDYRCDFSSILGLGSRYSLRQRI